ncbi:conserved hypothetical protein [Brugia malayi]|uniref:Secreted protein n=1 Tax=Brugia malayi TaxID=6279 RepID=A0A4E9FRY2_BRUMA|nr:uncharacterized protein BM_BM9271 [Brugia malayi]VIO99976.1 conserved hypothetical protein [Brugia malayi]
MRFLSYLLLVMMAEVVLTKEGVIAGGDNTLNNSGTTANIRQLQLPEFTDPVIIVGVVWLVSLLHLRQYTTAQMLFLLKVKRIWVVTAKRHQAE